MQPFDANPKARFRTLWMPRSNDQANLHYVVRHMQYPINSCRDLEFLVPSDLSASNPRPKRFVLYTNSRNHTMMCAEFLRKRVGPQFRSQIPWVHLGMSDAHRREVVKNLADGTVLGTVCTDALGLVHPLICTQ